MTNSMTNETAGLTPQEQRVVLDTALQLLSEFRLQATFVEQIAEKCGIPARRIYVHFGGTEKLLEALLQRELELMAASVPVPALRFPDETLYDEIEVLARIIMQECRAHIGFLRTMLMEAIRNPEFAAVFYRTFIFRGRQHFMEFLNARKATGEVRPDLDSEAASAFFLSALIFSLLLLEIFGGKSVEQVDDERLVKTVAELFLKGAASEECRTDES